MTRWGISIAFLALLGCTRSSPLPEMQAGETGRVTKIIDGDALVLDSGQSVRLVSVLAPVLAPRDTAPDPFAGESARILEDMALGREVRLYYPGLTRDRYDRALAHVITIDGAGSTVWLNRAMIEHGAARVRLYPSTGKRGQELLALEDAARVARKGLWAKPDYQVRDASEIDASARGFHVINGTLGEPLADASEDRYKPACLRALRGVSLKVRVRASARSACGLANGTPVRLRGWVSEQELELSHPWHVEFLDPG